MTVHAFVDESIRGRSYIVCAALVDPAQLKPVRKAVRSVLLPRQRELHFKLEKAHRQRLIADHLARLPVEILIYQSDCQPKHHEAARQHCLEALAHNLLSRRAQRLVLDSRGERDTIDQRTLYRALGRKPSSTYLTYEHFNSTGDCLLWIADAVGWCYGAAGDWRRRVKPIIADVQQINPR